MSVGRFVFKGRRWVQLSALFLFASALFSASLWGKALLRSILRLDPLWLFGRFVGFGGLALLASGFAVGRAFCGWICPLGTLLELCPSKKGPSTPRSWDSSGVLALSFAATAVVLGFSLPLAFSPLSLWVRSIVLLLFPPLSFVGERLLQLTSPLWERLGLEELAYASLRTFHFQGIELALGIFAGVFALNLIAPRFWCRHICPLGALLGFVSRWSLLRRRMGDLCASCGLCVRHCPMGAIPPKDPARTRRDRCILCGICISFCPQNIVRFGLLKGEALPGFLPSRRAVLISLGLGAFTGILSRRVVSRVLRPSHLIRPPNALPEEEFLDRCVRCGVCIRVCPTDGLQPMLLEGGMEALWTPRLIPRIGPCEPECALCGDICPTGAIRPFSAEEKPSLKLGVAVVQKDRCLAWGWGRACLVCDEACPYDAVELEPVPGKDVRGPVVYREWCVGCGLCEHRCPVPGEAAIRVERRT
ncbi:MAG TPA: 4Fe-4S dicluster domain-containing protein [Candidatus Latescibacteria bacterium]|nr:4Fe-4S dicluster domain-containing protein [Candidatus Latescibacterota bacterium]